MFCRHNLFIPSRCSHPPADTAQIRSHTVPLSGGTRVGTTYSEPDDAGNPRTWPSVELDFHVRHPYRVGPEPECRTPNPMMLETLALGLVLNLSLAWAWRFVSRSRSGDLSSTRGVEVRFTSFLCIYAY
jgi:hypothetical protein